MELLVFLLDPQSRGDPGAIRLRSEITPLHANLSLINKTQMIIILLINCNQVVLFSQASY